MGLDDDVRDYVATAAAEARLKNEREDAVRAARLAWLTDVAEFVDLCVRRSIPTRRVLIRQEHDSGAGRFLRELVGADSVVYSRAGSTRGWGPLLSHSGETSSSFIAITPDRQVLKVDSDLVHIRPNPETATRSAESPYWYETARKSMVRFLAPWPAE